jgi:orotidine-5'-phosphate decarboxylase
MTMMVRAADRVIVALDVPTEGEAVTLVERLGDEARLYKVGSQLYTAVGPQVVRSLVRMGKDVFLDLKFHDIPTTVAGAVRAAAGLGVRMLTVHAAGGPGMLAAARAAAGDDGPLVLAVTVLTSLGADDVGRVFGRAPISIIDEVVRLAGLAAEARLFGVVASVNEVKPIKRRYADVLRVVTPGIRLPDDSPGDQTRYASPGDAARAGADFIVVGRSVTAAEEPRAALRRVRDAFDDPPRS